MEQKKEFSKRIVIEVSNEIHIKIKMHATKRNITIRKWALRALLKAIKEEEKYEQQNDLHNVSE